MKPKKPKHKVHKQMLDTATDQFQRTGRIPALRLREHPGTGEFSFSALPDDCEDGMRRTTHRIPTNNQPHEQR